MVARGGKAAQHTTDDKRETLRLADLVIDERLQFRPLDRGTVRKYASVYRLGGQMPPVRAARLNDALVLTDGWHRVAALESLYRQEVEALIEPASSEKEVLWLAAKANTEHGLPLKSKQYREVFRAYIHARKHRHADNSFKSYREIAAEIGGARGYTTIRNWMEKDFPSVFRAMGGHDEGSEKQDAPKPTVTLGEIALSALSEARAAIAGVTDPEEVWEIVEVLETMLKVAREKPRKCPDF